MASLFDIAKSGVQSYRQALSVTGQNIANINTEGYRRREASLSEVTATQGGITAVSSQAGLGVRVEGIRRSFDAFLLDRANSTTAEYERVNAFLDQIKSLENTLLPSDADLGAQIGRFFSALQEVAAAPGDLPPRILALEEGRGLADAFRTLAGQLDEIRRGALSQAQDSATAINLLSEQLAEVNSRLLSSGQGGQAPNSVLDLRDRVITDLSKLVDVTVNYADRGIVNLSLGSSGVGPSLVTADKYNKVGVVDNQTSLQAVILSGGSQTPTNQIGRGALAGFIDGYEFVGEAVGDIDFLASTVSREMNAQHRLGLTMDGVAGGDLFAAQGLTTRLGQANRGEVTVDLQVTDPALLPQNDFTLTYRGDAAAWVVSTGNVALTSLGNNRYSADGFNFTLGGAPQDGDIVTLSATSGAAAQMQFLPARPQDLAAAGATNVMQDTANESDATLIMREVEPTVPSVPASITGVLKNSNSPVVATQFLRDGVVAAIPAGTQNISLSSFAEQARAQFEVGLTEIRNNPRLSLALVTGNETATYQFDLSFATAYPRETGASNWLELTDLTEALNRGILRADSGESLADLGIFASGTGGQLTLAAAAGQFSTDTRFDHSNGSASPIISQSAPSSTIQVFTREGRHLAGAPLTAEQITNLLVAENGFVAGADYRADYLNNTTDAYRGMEMRVSRTGGMQRIDIGANGDRASALGAFGDVPVSATDRYAMTVTLDNGRTLSVDIPSGASAQYAAQQFNDQFGPLGVSAEAQNRFVLSGFTQTGEVSFDLESLNQRPIRIAAEITPENLGALVDAINGAASLTGVSATLNGNRDKVILVAEQAQDVMLSALATDSPAFFGEVINTQGEVVSDRISFNSGDTPANAGRFSGTIEMVSASPFSAAIGESVLQSQTDPHIGGMVRVAGNLDGSQKTVSFGAEPEIDGNLEDSAGLRAYAASAVYRLQIPAEGEAPQFSAEISSADFEPISSAEITRRLIEQLRGQAPISSVSGATMIAADSRPLEGDAVTVSFDDSLYTLTVSNGEIEVSGGEAGRLTAFYDADGYMQIVSSGTLSAQTITVVEDTVIAGNADAAARFGLSAPMTRLTGTEINLAGSDRAMTFTFGDVEARLGIDENGLLDETQLPAGLSVGWRDAGIGQGRLVFTYASDAGPLVFAQDQATEALGFKTANISLTLSDAGITVRSSDGKVVKLEAEASSLAAQNISLSNLPNEDLIIIMTGGGARSLGAAYDIAPVISEPPAYDVRIVNEAGTQIEIFDAETGHSVATRNFDAQGEALFGDMAFQLNGRGLAGDVFHIMPNIGGTGDARNIMAILALQNADVNGANSGGFQSIFGQLVTQVGASVRSNDIALEAAQSSRDAAREAEMSFSGVNLDSEAAALLEYQQAYQASARVLSTARELFQTLMDVV